MKTRALILRDLHQLYIPGYDFHLTDDDQTWITAKAKDIAAAGGGDRDPVTVYMHSRSGLIFELGSTRMIDAYPNPLAHDSRVLESYDHDARIVLEEEIRLEFKKIGESQSDLDLEVKPNNRGYPSVKQQIKNGSSCDVLIFGWTNKISDSHYEIYWKFLVDGKSLKGMIRATNKTGEEKARVGSYFYMTKYGKSQDRLIEINPMSGVIVPARPGEYPAGYVPPGAPR